MKKSTWLLIIGLFMFNNVYSQIGILDTERLQIKTFISEIKEKLGIPGLAVAIIKNKKVVYKDYLGFSNLEYKVPITKESLFRLHSLSKIFVSLGIFQLIESNKISLDDSISKYINDLPESWKKVKISNLLSHSSGLPDMREESLPVEEDARKKVYGGEKQFEHGTSVSYNQTNFWLLNRIIKNLNDGDFQGYIINQFQKESKVTFSNDDDIVENRVTEYQPGANNELKHHHFFIADYMYGAGGLTISLDDFIDWDLNLKQNKLISADSKNQMFKEFNYTTPVPYAFTNGWFILQVNNIPSYGFNGGGLVNYRYYPDKDLSIIWLTNGCSVRHNIDDITNTLFGYLDEELKDRTEDAQKEVYELFETGSSRKAVRKYKKLKHKYPFVNFENVLNSIGYYFLSQKKKEQAISIFILSTEEFPQSANTYDSLGEAYLENNELKLSLENYKKSLKLNPVNENAKMKIDLIKERLEND